MKRLFTSVVLFLAATAGLSAAAYDTYVNGYTRKDGTHVQGHYRTRPDSNPYNNYSTEGNVNPYTGKSGTKDASDNDSGPSFRRTWKPTSYDNDND